MYTDDDGFVGCVTRFGANAPRKILNALAEAFDTDIVSEYEPQFWGFETQEEWDAAMEKLARESDDEFYMDFLKYLRGEPHERIQPGTLGMSMAEDGKRFVEADPSLLLPENKDKVLKMMWDSLYEGDLVVKGTLSPKDIALVKMIATQEDDLPRA